MKKDITHETFKVKSFGEKFRELRNNAGLKQTFFENSGYRKNSLSMFENNRRTASLDDRKKLVDIVRKTTELAFDYEYYYSSAEEELIAKVNLYKDSLYDDSDAFARAVGQALMLKMDQLATELYYEKGKRLYSKNMYRESIRDYMNALKYISNQKSVRPEIYKSIADSFEMLNEMTASEIYLQMAIDINKDDKSLRFRCLYGLAKVYVDLKDNVRCENILNMIYNEYGESKKIHLADMVKATLIKNTGDITSAIEFAMKKLSDSDTKHRDIWLHNVSCYYSANGEYEKAVEYLLDALEIRKDSEKRAISLNLLADTYIHMKRLDDAELILDNLYAEICDTSNVFHLLKWYENKIRVCEAKHKYEESERLMGEAYRNCTGYSMLGIWYIDRIGEIVSGRRQRDEEMVYHCESILRMMSLLAED